MLHLQFDPMHFKFMEKSLRFRPLLRQVLRPRYLQLSFCATAQLDGFLLSGF
jgi:hypothetical protein